jgi:hypothetical protein
MVMDDRVEETMPKVCAWCNRNIDTKRLACFRCGDELVGTYATKEVAPGKTIKLCYDCNDAGKKARETVSHGICSDCDAEFN